MGKNSQRLDMSVKCPYYRTAGDRQIHCDAPDKRLREQVMVFKRTEDRKEYMEGVCCSRFGGCRLCRELDKAHDFNRE